MGSGQFGEYGVTAARRVMMACVCVCGHVIAQPLNITGSHVRGVARNQKRVVRRSVLQVRFYFKVPLDHIELMIAI